jgi:hypothetical protein
MAAAQQVRAESGRLFNLDMIAHGYASEYTYDLPYRYQLDFKAAENERAPNTPGKLRRRDRRGGSPMKPSLPMPSRRLTKKMVMVVAGVVAIPSAPTAIAHPDGHPALTRGLR